jgi:putative ABC transport system permease protein
MTPKWRRYLRFWRPDVRADVDDEFSFHMQERVEDLVARGMDERSARLEATRLFGDWQGTRQECIEEALKLETDMRRLELLDVLKQDALYALRLIRAHPTFTGAIMLTLALGIGATTAVFSVVNAVLLQPLPYRDADRVVLLAETFRGGRGNASGGHFTDWTTQSRTIETTSIWQSRTINLTEGEPERLRAARVTPSFFDVMHMRPALGRYFLPDENADSRVAVLSHPLWTTRFSGDSSIIGKQIRLSGEPHTVVGVAPPSITMTEFDERLWTPFALATAQASNYGAHTFTVFGKLKAGATVAQAQADLAGITEGIRQRVPDEMNERGVQVVPYRSVLVDTIDTQLWVLLGAVSFVLLIGCANIVSLLLARATSRRKEIAIRGALGGARMRLVRQLLTESMVMAGAGGLAGLLVAKLGIRFLVGMGPDGVPRLTEAGLSWQVLGFAMTATLLCGIVFGLVPAFRATRVDLQTELRDGGRGSRGVIRDRVRGTLIVTEMAVALVLVVSAGLLLRSAYLLQRVDPGFDPKNVTMLRVALPALRYDSAEAVQSGFTRILEQMRAIPGVELAAAGTRVPMWGGSIDIGVRVDGRPFNPKDLLIGHVRLVTDKYFETIGIPIIKGRSLQPGDVSAGAPSVVVVSETFARRTFGDENPIGKRISGWTRDSMPEWREVVGVSGDVRAFGREVDSPPEIYMPMTHAPSNAWASYNRSMTFIVKSRPGTSVTAAMRAALRNVDTELPAYDVQTMETVLARSTATRRFNTMLLSSLGLTGLLLAAIGIYGVIAFFVNQRTHEIGVRMALGASTGSVVRLVVRHAAGLAIIGIVLGGLAAYWATNALASMLFSIDARDPMAFVAAALVLLLVALGAAWIPARRASRVPPISALTESL